VGALALELTRLTGFTSALDALVRKRYRGYLMRVFVDDIAWLLARARIQRMNLDRWADA
jgi:hypothetical protein